MSYTPIYRDAPGIGSPPAHWEIDTSESAEAHARDAVVAESLGTPNGLMDLIASLVSDTTWKTYPAKPATADGAFDPDADAAALFVSAMSDSCVYAEQSRRALALRLAAEAETQAEELFPDPDAPEGDIDDLDD